MSPEIDPRETHLFLDDSVIESYARVHRTIHQPQKLGPVLRPDRPWEGNCVVLYGSVIRRNGKFMMWYQTFNKVDPPENTYVCYAESEDGITWHKPNLGNISYRGSNDNNIVLEPMDRGIDSPSVILDENDTEDRRFKMLVYGRDPQGERGLFALFSRDGKHWGDASLVARNVGDRTNIMIDPAVSNPFVAFTRRHTMMRDHLRRVIYRTESNDFEEWSDPKLVLKPDLADSHDLQFYGMSGFKYAGMYIGFLQCLHTKDDLIDVQLVTSRDNRNWTRTAPRSTFMPTGRSTDWDTTWISFSSSPPIAHGERLWLYYEDRSASHGQVYPFPRGHIDLATLRLDGFASIDAGPCWGHLTTKLFEWPGGDLVVNVNAKAAAGITDRGQLAGSAAVEILSQNGSVVEGMDRESCEPFTGDSTEYKFIWNTGKTMRNLTGTRVKIRFHLLNSQLFAFRTA